MKLLQLFIIGGVCLIHSTALAAEEKWHEQKSTHFVIYYKKASPSFIDTLEASAEDYYHEIASNLGFTRYKNWTWDERARIYIFDNQDDYLQSGRAAGWSAGHADPRNKIIRTFPSAVGFFDTTLPHELGHIIFREFIGNNIWVPHWFEEGVAMYQEKAKRWGAHDDVRKEIEKEKFIELQELDQFILDGNSSQDVANLYYMESASVVNYVIDELGQTRFSQFCRKLRDGMPFMTALKAVYVRFKDLKDLNKAWVNFLND